MANGKPKHYKELNCDQWEVDHTCEYLRDEGHGEWVDKFKERKLTGKWLQFLTLDHLEEMGIQNRDDSLKVQRSIRKLWELTEQGKVFNDPIHGHMELHPLLVKIIDTPQFQRLRNIKQLGGAYFVYPGASHNRFEHSIGVGHLAGELVKALHARQPELNITARDILCVQIAGLCHDLGHGPFSHLYDGMFIPQTPEGNKWKHEDASVQMFYHLVKCNDLEEEMRKYGLKLPQDQTFIEEMIKGLKAKTADEWPYQGRPQEKSFLYEIVANKENEIDVDKFDYFARDCHHLGIRNNFDHLRYFRFARVCEMGEKKHICSRDKEVNNLYDMFHTRYSLHRRAYQHNVNTIVQFMIAEAFLKADEHIQIKGSGGKMFTLSTAIKDMEAYTKLTDRVFEQILNSYSPTMAEARQILNKTISENLSVILTAIKSKESSEPTKIDRWRVELAELDAEEVVIEKMLNSSSESRQELHKIISEKLPHLLNSEKPTQEQIKRWREELAKLDDEEDVIRELLNSSSEDLAGFRRELHKIISEKLPNLLNSEKFTQEKIKRLKEELDLENEPDERAVVEKILNSSYPRLAEACWILHKIISRKHYRFLGEIQDPNQTKLTIAERKKKEAEALQGGGLKAEDFEVLFISMDYGMKDEDPINQMDFYGKDNTSNATKIFKDQVSKLLPASFSETLIRVYCKKTDKTSLTAAKKQFAKWRQKKCPSSTDGEKKSTEEEDNRRSSQGEGQEPPVQNPEGE